jgi:hypothetical protein
VVQLDRDRWLVPGMEVTIEIDPEREQKVHTFTIDWDSVPTIAERVSANDPALADPRTARQAAHEAQAGAADHAHAPTGVISQLSDPFYGLGPHPSIAPSSGLSCDVSGWSAKCDAAIAAAATGPAPDGQRRGVAILAAIRLVFRNVSHRWDGAPDLTGDLNAASFESGIRGNEAVFAINLPGEPPYAVLARHFKAPHDRPMHSIPDLFPWLPVLVSDRDSSAFDVVWDEVPTEMGRINERISEDLEERSATVQAIQEAASGPAPAGQPAPQLIPTDLSAFLDPKRRGDAIKATMDAAAQMQAQALAQSQAAAQAAAQSAAEGLPVAEGHRAGPEAAPTGAPVDPDAGLRAAARLQGERLRALPRREQKQLISSLKMGLRMMDKDSRKKYAEMLRAEGIDV